MRVDRWGDVLRALPVLQAALGSNVPRTRARARMPLPPVVRRTAQGSCMCAFRFTRLRMAGLLARCGIRCSRMPRCRLTPRLTLSGREVNLRSRFEIAMLCDDINGTVLCHPAQGTFDTPDHFLQVQVRCLGSVHTAYPAGVGPQVLDWPSMTARRKPVLYLCV